MRYAAFQRLNGAEQMKQVSEHGQCVLVFRNARHTRHFYRLRSFFVELSFTISETPVIEITAFTMAHRRFIELLCLLPATPLSVLNERNRLSPLSVAWN